MAKSLCAKCGNETDDRFLHDCEECGRALCLTCYGTPEGEVWCQQCVDVDGKRMTVVESGDEESDFPCPDCGKKAIADHAGLLRTEPKIHVKRWRCGTDGCGWTSKQWGIRELDADAEFKKNWKDKNPNGA